MNFCGADYEKQVQDTKLPQASFHCGPCVQDENAHLDAVFSEDDPLIEQNPLDIIEQKLAEDIDNKGRGSKEKSISALVTVHDTPPIRSLISNVSSATSITPASGRYRAMAGNTTPSSITLNPLRNTNWIEQPTRRKLRSDLDIPSLHQPDIQRAASGSIEGLLKRLEDGFRVKLHTNSLSAIEDVLMYLDSRRRRICLQGDHDEKKSEDVDFWEELPIARILRLEIDRKTRRTKNTLQTFSMVLDSDKKKGVTYYDFEAESPIEREIIVATLMVVLEQAYNTTSQDESSDQYGFAGYVDGGVEDVDGGTLDQPIVCSPSLEEQMSLATMDAQYTPRRTTQLHGGTFGDAEASLVINLEHLDDSALLTPKLDELRRRTMSQADMNGGPVLPGTGEDLLIECKGSTQLASGWCSDDICSLALKDIADTCSGIFVLKQAEAGMCTITGITDEQRLMIEEYIASALGAPSAAYSYLSEVDVWKAKNLETETEPSAASQGRIRNRASVLNAQCDRLHKLRQEMTFAAALKASRERMTLQTTQSFDDAKILRSKGLIKNEKEVVSQFHSSALLKHVVGNLMVTAPPEKEGEEVAFYDSDPEDARPRMLNKKDPRQVAAERRKREKVKPESPNRALRGPGFSKIKGSNKRVSKKLDEETIVQIVQQMTNERLTLMWHPTQDGSEPNRSPVCVKVWIESGVCLIDGTFLLPKLSWAKFEAEATSGRRIEQTEPQKLDLLDICRIHTAETIDRSRNPFAVARKSFVIETQHDAFMFEAQTTEECDRIVFGLKLVIARLASLLMLRDVRAAEEFFGAIAANVPGEAPEWAKGGGETRGPTSLTSGSEAPNS